MAGLSVLDGTVALPDDVSPLDEGVPAQVLRALLAGDHVLDRHTATRLRAAADDLPVPEVWDDDLRDVRTGHRFTLFMLNKPLLKGRQAAGPR